MIVSRISYTADITLATEYCVYVNLQARGRRTGSLLEVSRVMPVGECRRAMYGETIIIQDRGCITKAKADRASTCRTQRFNSGKKRGRYKSARGWQQESSASTAMLLGEAVQELLQLYSRV